MSGFLDWKAGDKIVCIDDSASGSAFEPKRLLQLDAIYTISAISMGYGTYQGKYVNCPVVDLVEVTNQGMFGTTYFAAARFRPVAKRTTSIECFRSLLNPSPADKADIALADFVYEHSTPMQEQFQ